MAVKNETIIGFAQTGFGPNAQYTDLSPEEGVICMIVASPTEFESETRAILLKEAEDHLISRGAKIIHAVGSFPNNPFYIGLYGGSRLPGVLAEDMEMLDLFSANEYLVQQKQLIFQLQLSNFRPKIDRQQISVKRNYEVRSFFDPRPLSWWHACTLGHANQMHFTITCKDDGIPCGEMTFWDMQPLSRSWGVKAFGLYDLKIDEENRRSGLATFLICEALKELDQNGISIAEVQTNEENVAAISLFEKLGFHKIDHGVVMQKSV